MESFHCNTCGTVKEFSFEQQNINLHGYSSLVCNGCTEFKLFKCGLCEKTYVYRNGDRRNIERHMKQAHPDSYTSVNFELNEQPVVANDSEEADVPSEEFYDCQEDLTWGGGDDSGNNESDETMVSGDELEPNPEQY